MIEIHESTISSPFPGTIVDIETIGNFDLTYAGYDLKRYRNIRQVILGYITSDSLDIYCCESESEIKPLALKTKALLFELAKPFYAFNCDFEKKIWQVHGFILHNMEELQCKDQFGFETKAQAVEGLGIPQYDDPFDDNGLLAADAWSKGDFSAAIAHNRSCLLKERDIAIMRYLKGR